MNYFQNLYLKPIEKRNGNNTGRVGVFCVFLTVNGKYINPMSELSNTIWKFESQSRLEKAQQWFDNRKSDNMYSTFLSIKQ